MGIGKRKRNESVGAVQRWLVTIDLALKSWVEIIDKSRHKIRQASLLTYSYFVMFKGFEAFLDTLWVRFGLKLKVHAPLFYPKATSSFIRGYIKQRFISESHETRHK